MSGYTAYINAINPRKSKRARLNQYHREKSKLLPLYPVERHDEIIRALAKRLKI